MWELLLASENFAFSVALALMLLIGITEVCALVVGHSLSGSLDSLLPDAELNPHTEVGLTDADGALSRLLGWLRIGQVPLLMLLVIFLFNFGVLGLLLQGVLRAAVGMMLPGWLAAPLVLVASLPGVRFCGGVLQQVMPRDETTAVSDDALIGRAGIITLGIARAETPAEARVKDQHGYNHYLRVVPDIGGQELQQGTSILVVSREGGVYTVIENSNPHLTD